MDVMSDAVRAAINHLAVLIVEESESSRQAIGMLAVTIAQLLVCEPDVDIDARTTEVARTIAATARKLREPPPRRRH
jgi:hypothetical protein